MRNKGKFIKTNQSNLLSVKNIFDTFFLIFVSVFPFRLFLGPNTIGEPFDTKAQLIFHDHWYKFLIGEQDFYNLGIFYPYSRSFALSDLFIVSGPIHAFFRLLNFNLVNSLELATLSVIIIGNIGWLFLAKGFLRNNFLRYLFVLTISSSSTYVGHIYLKPNAAAYGLISWLLVLLIKLANSKNQSKNVNSLYFGFLMLMPAIYALNVWYTAYFSFIFLSLSLIVFGFIAISTKNLKKVIKLVSKVIADMNLRIVIAFLILAGSLYGFFILTYFPELNNGYGDTNKQILLDNSPSLPLLFDSSGFGGGIFSNIYLSYLRVPTNTVELNLGVTLLLLIPFMIATLMSLRALAYSNNSLVNTFHFSVLLSALILLISIIKISPNWSIFSFLWDNIFLLRTMRVPARLLIVFNFIAIIYIFKYVNELLESPSKLTKYLVYVYLIVLMLDQQRTPTIFWTQNELIDQQTLSFSDKINDCSAFILNREEVGWWKDTIDAMVLSNLTGIPTVNGFSSNNPRNFPNISWSGNESLEPIINWLKTNNEISGICLITQNSSVTRLPINGVRLFLNQGFLLPKSDDKSSEIQIGLSNAKISFQNLSSIPGPVILSIKMNSLPCMQNQKVRLLINDELDLNINLTESPEAISIRTLIPQWEHKILNFILTDNYCVNDNNEKIYLQLDNLDLKSSS